MHACRKDTENRILRGKLPRQIDVTPAERARLIKLGARLGSRLKDVITIVHPRTFARWLKEKRSGVKRRKRGRPRKPEEIRQLIVGMAKETGCHESLGGLLRHYERAA